jgi:hypothetical protein
MAVARSTPPGKTGPGSGRHRFHDVHEDIIESRRLQARGEGIRVNDLSSAKTLPLPKIAF